MRHKVAGTGNFWVNAINFRVITVRVGPRAIRFYLRLYLFHIQPVITFVRDCIVIFILIFYNAICILLVFIVLCCGNWKLLEFLNTLLKIL